MIEGYGRPAVELDEIRDDDGAVIPYGERWPEMTPPDDAYSVVTHPERYKPLHRVARSLAEQLASHYDAELGRGDAAEFAPMRGVLEVLTLTPSDPAAASIRIALTDFPGVVVNAGAGASFAFPACGCDACDEGVTDQIDEFENTLEGVVNGDFREYVTSDGVGHTLAWESGMTGGIGRDADPGRRAAVANAPAEWAAWTAR